MGPAPSRAVFVQHQRSLRLSRLATAVVRLLNGFLLALLAFEFKEGGSALDFSALIGAAGVGFGLASVISPWLERHLREEPMVVAALALEAAAAFVAGQFFSLGAAAGLAGAAGLAWGTAKFGFDGLLQSVVHPARRGGAFTRAETLFQLAWVVGAVLPVGMPDPGRDRAGRGRRGGPGGADRLRGRAADRTAPVNRGPAAGRREAVAGPGRRPRRAEATAPTATFCAAGRPGPPGR